MTFSLIFVLSISAPVGCQFFAFSRLFPHSPFPADKKNHDVFFTQEGPARPSRPRGQPSCLYPHHRGACIPLPVRREGGGAFNLNNWARNDLQIGSGKVFDFTIFTIV